MYPFKYVSQVNVDTRPKHKKKKEENRIGEKIGEKSVGGNGKFVGKAEGQWAKYKCVHVSKRSFIPFYA